MKLGYVAAVLMLLIASAFAQVVVQSYEKHYDSDRVSIARHVEIARLATSGYGVPNNPVSQFAITTFTLTNNNAEPIAEVVLTQTTRYGDYVWRVQSVEPGATVTKTFFIEGISTEFELPAPQLSYSLPPLVFSGSDGRVGENAQVWVRTQAAQVIQKLPVYVRLPAGALVKTETDASGKIEFEAKELGQYAFGSPHRESAAFSVYVYEKPVVAQAEPQKASKATATLPGSNALALPTNIPPLLPVAILALLVGLNYVYKNHFAKRLEAGPEEILPPGASLTPEEKQRLLEGPLPAPKAGETRISEGQGQPSTPPISTAPPGRDVPDQPDHADEAEAAARPTARYAQEQPDRADDAEARGAGRGAADEAGAGDETEAYSVGQRTSSLVPEMELVREYRELLEKIKQKRAEKDGTGKKARSRKAGGAKGTRAKRMRKKKGDGE